jgi:hypothetical protein
VWATVPGSSRVVRIDVTGRLVEETRGLTEPTSIAIDPGR